MTSFDTTLSVEQLEKDKWKEPESYPTGLVEKCFKYRKIPVKDLSVEHLRTLVGQNIGLKYLIPIAVERLKENILAEGDLYPGDLLSAVITTEIAYWKTNPVFHKTLVELIQLQSEVLKYEIINREFHRNIETFKSILG